MGTACPSGDGSGGVSSLFESLNGTYRVTEDADCFIDILGSRVRTLDGAGRTTCERERFESRDTLSVSGTLADDRISGTLTATEVWDITSVCTRTTTTTATGEANKLTGREASGRFAGIAGTWSGRVTITESVAYDGECFDDGPSSTTDSYDFEADIRGTFATVTYEDGDDVDTFEIAETASGDVLIDGEVVEVQ